MRSKIHPDFLTPKCHTRHYAALVISKRSYQRFTLSKIMICIAIFKSNTMA